MLKIENISKVYGESIIFENLNYEFNNQGFYTILGKSGCGKSTLLNILSLIEKPTEGKYLYNNENLLIKNENYKRDFRLDNMAFIFQSFNLFENDTVFNNILLTLDAYSKESFRIKTRKIEEILHIFDIYKLKNELVKNLSGGEKQRVAIARSLINNPPIILADEPSGSLDENNSKIVFDILKRLSLDHLVILVTHNKKLAYEYSDYILKIERNEIKEEILDNKKEVERFLFNKEREKNKDKKINYLFKFSHLKTLFKSKKGRMSATIAFLSFSFLMSGLTFFLKDGLTSIINNAFSSLSGENTLLVKRKDDESSILSYSSASYLDVYNIMKNNPSDVDYIGSTYLNNLNEFFIEEDSLYFVDKNKKRYLLDNYSSSSFLNFKYVKSINSLNNVYPKIKDKLRDEEIIITLNNENMISLCKNLKINQTYETLGNYIKDNSTYLIFKTRNDYRTYEDENLFILKGIIPGRISTIYSNNYLFNECVFENKLLFPSSLDILKEEDKPWVLKKVYYFHTTQFQSYLINKLIKENSYRKFIFDSDKEIYNLNNNDETYTNRVFCYEALKNTIDLSYIDELVSLYGFKNYYYSTDGGYLNFGDLLNGFYRPTFFSKSLNKINDIIDLNTSISYEEFYELEGSNEIAIGNYLKTGDDIVKFSSSLNKEIDGYYPSSPFEIAISSHLKELLNIKNYKDEVLFISTIDSLKEDKEGNYLTSFKTIKLKISGIVKENSAKIYHNSDYSLTLFRDLFKISSFELNINSVTFFLDNPLKEEEIKFLNQNSDKYSFSVPLSTINESVNEISYYVFYVLFIFSLISFISSLILFSIINYISFLEEKREIAILITLGFKNKEIIKYYLFNNNIIGIIALILAIFNLLIVSFSFNIAIKLILGVTISLYFSFIPILIMILILILMSLLSLISILKPLKRINIKKELH